MVVVLTVCFYSFKSYYPFSTSVMIIDIELIFVGVKGVSGIANRATFRFLLCCKYFQAQSKSNILLYILAAEVVWIIFRGLIN